MKPKMSEDLQKFVELAEKEQITVSVRKRYANFLRTDENGNAIGSYRKEYASCESPKHNWVYADMPRRAADAPYESCCVFSFEMVNGRASKWIHFPFLDPKTAVGLVKWNEEHRIKKGETK